MIVNSVILSMIYEMAFKQTPIIVICFAIAEMKILHYFMIRHSGYL